MRLIEVLKDIQISKEYPAFNKDIDITSVTCDSREVKKGALFIAIKGTSFDGHIFINNAIKSGAAAIMVDENFRVSENFSIPLIAVSDTREGISIAASNFYKKPFEKLFLIGITGTNGKTTTSYLIENILNYSEIKTGLMGTVDYRFADEYIKSSITTPDSVTLMEIMAKMKISGVSHVVMEVSSHALDQKRVSAIPFNVGVFTNLTRDHMDYHNTLENYFQAKSLLFKNLSHSAWAVINGDCDYGTRLVEMTNAKIITYGFSNRCDIQACEVDMNIHGTKGLILSPFGNFHFFLPIPGKFNVYNALAAFAVGICSGIDAEKAAEALSIKNTIPGRLESIANRSGKYIFVDYSHTPDALEKAIKTLRPLVSGRIITVFGCGGDRDKGKRPIMGEIAVRLSDIAILTSDNPRTEDPEKIIKDILVGIQNSSNSSSYEKKYFIDSDRRKAIFAAISTADKDDAVLIAGKGHETYQIIGTVKQPFDDRLVALEATEVNL